MADMEDLEVTALNALAASPGGEMTLPSFTAHLESRLGSASEASKSAQSAESRGFRDSVMSLISGEPGSGSIVDRGFVTLDQTGALLRITEAGRASIGR